MPKMSRNCSKLMVFFFIKKLISLIVRMLTNRGSTVDWSGLCESKSIGLLDKYLVENMHFCVKVVPQKTNRFETEGKIQFWYFWSIRKGDSNLLWSSNKSTCSWFLRVGLCKQTLAARGFIIFLEPYNSIYNKE